MLSMNKTKQKYPLAFNIFCSFDRQTSSVLSFYVDISQVLLSFCDFSQFHFKSSRCFGQLSVGQMANSISYLFILYNTETQLRTSYMAAMLPSSHIYTCIYIYIYYLACQQHEIQRHMLIKTLKKHRNVRYSSFGSTVALWITGSTHPQLIC